MITNQLQSTTERQVEIGVCIRTATVNPKQSTLVPSRSSAYQTLQSNILEFIVQLTYWCSSNTILFTFRAENI